MGDEQASYAGLSNLPNDVLVSIIDKLELREAVLSRRWSRLHAQLPQIVLDVDDFVVYDGDVGDLENDNTQLATTDHEEEEEVKEYNEGDEFDDDVMISSLQQANDRLLEAATKMNIYPSLSSDDDIRSELNDMEEYGRRYLSLVGTYPRVFAALTTLFLDNIMLPDFSSAIIVACTNLQFLTLQRCDQGRSVPTPPLEIRHPNLVYIKIAWCNFSVVKLQWLPQLRRFTIWDWSGTIRSNIPTFFGHVAPLMEDLYIKVVSHPCKNDETEEERLGMRGLRNKSDFTWTDRLATGFKHHGLTRLTIFGFRSGDDRVVEYVRRVVEMAPRLEDLCLRDKEPCEDCNRINPFPTFPQTDEEKDSIRRRIYHYD
uniref:F-box domain-containing protein n=1 Tax=Leersia perrieri TaxID=77586 RepID=A0A0D9X3R8_9ORYZ